MAEYVNLDIEPVDPLRIAAAAAVIALREVQPDIALPPRRLDLEKTARDLERALEERAT